MTGRWPANVILSPAMAEVLDEQSGDLGPSRRPQSTLDRINAHLSARDGSTSFSSGKKVLRDDSGGASRFFLTAGYEPWELEWIYANGLRPCGMEEA